MIAVSLVPKASGRWQKFEVSALEFGLRNLEFDVGHVRRELRSLAPIFSYCKSDIADSEIFFCKLI